MPSLSDPISTRAAIEAIKAGQSIQDKTLSDLGSVRVDVMDALLLAEHGFLVPEGNIVYDDSKIAYDPDFDEGEWGAPVSVRQRSDAPDNPGKREDRSGSAKTEQLVVELSLDQELKNWLEANDIQLAAILEKLLTDLYQTEKLLKR